jgi:DNA-binding PadR family transcriptional regulator
MIECTDVRTQTQDPGRTEAARGQAYLSPGLGARGLGGRAFARGRKLAGAELQLLALRLLADGPSHGYQIIRALDERSRGFYVPSPGMIYPALNDLRERGHASVQNDANRKLYQITDAGRLHLERHRGGAEALLEQFDRVAQRMDRVRRALDAEEESAAPGSGPQRRGSPELLRARRDLELALAAAGDAPSEEQQRIAAILQHAAADITAYGTAPPSRKSSSM